MKLATTLAIVLFALFGQGCTSQQTQFASPDLAVQSLTSALRSNDRAHLKQILGPQSDEVLNSGDEIADRLAGQNFVAAYDIKHQLVNNDDGTVTLNIGDGDWPFPIPLVKDEKSGKWMFDTPAGQDELINRRIGRNELDVIQVCQAIGDAQREYAERDPDGDGIPEYAQKFMSDPGRKNGLYWKAQDGEPPSPLGPLVALAVEEGYFADTGAPAAPYHGYHYRMLTAQGPSAPGGEMSYIINGNMVGGFAVIAFPDQYGNSGIMTFIVNHDGTVYQQDLGTDTDKIAKAITAFDPDPKWKKVE